MPQRYTDQQKADILTQLSANFGNVALTARQTGIPARILYAWKREQQREHRADAALLHSKTSPPQHYTAANPDPVESPYDRIRWLVYPWAGQRLRSARSALPS